MKKLLSLFMPLGVIVMFCSWNISNPKPLNLVPLSIEQLSVQLSQDESYVRMVNNAGAERAEIKQIVAQYSNRDHHKKKLVVTNEQALRLAVNRSSILKLRQGYLKEIFTTMPALMKLSKDDVKKVFQNALVLYKSANLSQNKMSSSDYEQCAHGCYTTAGDAYDAADNQYASDIALCELNYELAMYSCASLTDANSKNSCYIAARAEEEQCREAAYADWAQIQTDTRVNYETCMYDCAQQYPAQ